MERRTYQAVPDGRGRYTVVNPMGKEVLPPMGQREADNFAWLLSLADAETEMKRIRETMGS